MCSPGKTVSLCLASFCTPRPNLFVSNSLWPARLLCPWEFPGNNTGGGFPFLSPGDLSDPVIEPTSPALVGRLPLRYQGSPYIYSSGSYRVTALPWVPMCVKLCVPSRSGVSVSPSLVELLHSSPTGLQSRGSGGSSS